MAVEPINIIIPESELPFFKFLAHIEDDFVQDLLSALASAKPNIDSESLTKQLIKESSLDYRNTSKALQILFRLSRIQRRFNLQAEDFIVSVAASLTSLTEGWAEEDTIAWKEKIPVFISLLASDGVISFGSKAGDLMLEQPLILCQTKVVTDSRPVFDENAERICGFVPFHTLVINVIEGGESRDIHLALDMNDVIQLQKQLERAEKKENILRSQLTDAGMQVVQTKADDL